MNLKENMGNVDRIIRAIAAVIFVGAFFNGITSGAFGIISLALAVVFLTNAIFGICLLYSIIGLNSKSKEAGY